MKKKKLDLKKKVIASLSDVQKAKVIGGDDEYTTSFSDCTGFLCCEDGDCATEESRCSCDELCNPSAVTECDMGTCNPANCA